MVCVRIRRWHKGYGILSQRDISLCGHGNLELLKPHSTMHDENKRAATLPMQVTLWRPQETGSFEQISSWIAKRPTESSNEMDEWEGFHLLASTRSYVIAECMHGGKFEPHAMLSLQEQTPAWSVNHDMT